MASRTRAIRRIWTRQKTADTIIGNRDVIVGIKTAHFAKPGWTAIDRAVEAGRRAKVPVMVDDRIFTNMGRTSKENCWST